MKYTKLSSLDFSDLSDYSHTEGNSPVTKSLVGGIFKSMYNPKWRELWFYWPVIIFPIHIYWQILTYEGSGNPEVKIDPLIGIFLPILLISLIRTSAGTLGLLRTETMDTVKLFARKNKLFLATNKKNSDEFECAIFQDYRSHKHELFLSDKQRNPNYFIATYQLLNRNAKFGDVYIVMSIKLPHQVTPIIIDSKANNVWTNSNLPAGFEHGPALSLEGNFQDYFNLYCVPGEEREVLSIITPERMALMIDYYADWDIEFWKDRIFLYQKNDISFEGRELPKLFSLLERIESEFVR